MTYSPTHNVTLRDVKPYLRVHILSKLRTRSLAGTACVMASDCPRQPHTMLTGMGYKDNGTVLNGRNVNETTCDKTERNVAKTTPVMTDAVR